jgi:disulfide bond formation protein DsbB
MDDMMSGSKNCSHPLNNRPDRDTTPEDERLLQRERRLLAMLGLMCLGLLGGALDLQFFFGEDPCPLCIMRRYFFLLVASFAFVGAGLNRWRGIAGSFNLELGPSTQDRSV